MFVDLHFHCLPGIDDGPRDWDAAVALCRAAAADGTTHIIATPHVLRDPWINDDLATRDALVAKLNELVGGAPVILPGSEVYYSQELVELWEAGRAEGAAGPLTSLNRGSYLLIEFPIREVPRNAGAILHELVLLGITPLIAHPERNLELAEDPDRLASLIERGAVTQITAGSYLGEFGQRAMESAFEITDAGRAFLVASDAHSVDRRPPRMAPARALIEARWGAETAKQLFETNPRAAAGLE